MDLRLTDDIKMAKLALLKSWSARSYVPPMLLTRRSQVPQPILTIKNSRGTFTCEWPNSQLDPPFVASLWRLVVINSMALCVIQHVRKLVASHSSNSYLVQTLPCHTGESRQSRPVTKHHRSVGNQSQVYHSGRLVVVVLGPWFMPINLRMACGGREQICRKSVVVRSQVTYYLANYTLVVYSYVHHSLTSM